MKAKRLLSAALALFITALSGGCGGVVPNIGSNNPEPSPDKTITLRFINSWGGSDPKSETLQTVFKSFMDENPDISVSNESLFGDDFLSKLKSDFASGNDPDVFGLWPGSDINTLVNVGKVADLTDVLEQDPEWKNSFGEMWDYTTFNKRIYGLPVEIIFEGLFINKDIFEKYDVKVPTNYEELKSAVVKFHKNGVTPIAFNCKAEGTYLYQNMAMMLGGKDAIENPIHDSRVDPSYISALYKLRELYGLHAFPDDVFTMTSVERNNLFRDKKAAMIVQGSWYTSALPDDGTVGIVPFPEMKDGANNYSTMVYGLGCGTFYMSSKAWNNPEKRDAALKLLRFLTSRRTAQMFAEKTGMLSCVKIPIDSIEYDRLTKSGINYIHSAVSLVGPPDSYLPRATWENVIVTYIPYVLEDKMTPEELWNRALESSATLQEG